MSAGKDSPERKAALRASADLKALRAAARHSHVGMRRLRWRVGGRICFTFQPYGTPYAEWGSMGRVYLDETGRLEEASYLTAVTDRVETLVELLDMTTTVGSALATLSPDKVVATPLDVLETITLDLAAEPVMEERVSNPGTGEVTIVVSPTYLPEYPATLPDESFEELSEDLIHWEPTARRAWLWLGLAVAFLLGSLTSWVYGAAQGPIGLVWLAIGLFGASWLTMLHAVDLHDRATSKKDLVMVGSSGKLIT